ncbi:MAG: T9SS type A sorting domain-containing protein [Bacteroidota bacterium]
MKSDSIVMSPGYANEVYYSMKNGVVKASPRSTWDIAFRTAKRSSSILTNDGAGVILYTYPKADTSGWAAMDTTGLSTWKPMYNDVNDWENGAFSRNASGHPDYGWAIYNSVTHDLNGDSLFVIKLRDGSFKKLWIIKKYSTLDIYKFRYANLDGTNEKLVSEDISSLTATDFSGYSLENNTRVSFEPVKSSWDILFTKYMSKQPDGSSYPATCVVSNDSVKTKKFHPVSLSYDDFGAGKWDSTRSSIGWDWKVFDMINFVYKIVDSTVYFVKPVNGDIYKLYFTYFAGSSTGVVKFNLEKAAGAGISDPAGNDLNVNIYPNPASGRINLNITGKSGEELSFFLTDLTGRQLRADRPFRLTDGLNAFSMDVTGVQPGVYFVTVCIAATKTVTKVIITR